VLVCPRCAALRLTHGPQLLSVARGKPIMMDWQSRDDDRNADLDWQGDWQRGHEIGLLIVGGLALVMAVVNVLLGGWETPAVAESIQSGPHNADYVGRSKVIPQSPASHCARADRSRSVRLLRGRSCEPAAAL
jgi:hypothetical protein